MQNYKVVSLFSGCGGLDLGIEGGFKYLNNYYEKNTFKIIGAASETMRLIFIVISAVLLLLSSALRSKSA